MGRCAADLPPDQMGVTHMGIKSSSAPSSKRARELVKREHLVEEDCRVLSHPFDLSVCLPLMAPVADEDLPVDGQRSDSADPD
ncbi:uncharacterized protein METZ01_LOCUS349574, partial [marine metagenome]